MSSSWIPIFIIASLALLGCCSAGIDYDSKAVIINGERKLIFSGAIHYPRSTAQMWPDLIKKAQEGGLNAIETYIFWDRHEPRRREYDFSGNLDFIKFFQTIQQAGLYAIMRIGPYVCAEWTYGGFPMWLHNTPGIELRTDNEIYKNEMQIFTTKIVNMCKEAKLFASQGGPIILAQIENEYGNIMGGYGDAGKRYINWCAQMAVAQNIGVPWIMCQQGDAPQPMINTCNGFYCDSFTPNSPNSPKMFTENWSGWFKLWGSKDPVRTAEDLAFSVARFFQNGGVLNNYYMYHGGTNFGRTAGGPYITTSYDYNAPLNEYGLPNEPKYSHLKQLHEAILSGEKILTNSTVTTKNFGNGVDLTTYQNSAGERFCYLSNADGSKDAAVDLGQDGQFNVPAWSVTILANCTQEIYNTAKVNSQTQVMVMKQNDKPTKVNWMWSPEAMKDTLKGNGRFRATQLLDQKEATADASDYLWYMTSVDINQTSWKTAILKVGTNGHALHIYVNGKRIGTWFSKQANGQQMVSGDDYSFVAQPTVSLKYGTNIISLVSATVGLANYGTRFDLKPVGLVGSSVQLIIDNTTVIDLTSNEWNYKVGLNGEAKQLFSPNSRHANVWRQTTKVPTGRPFTWYKTTFNAPSGTEPVVVDLKGMGKGHAWVNGNSLGRYWPSQIADSNGCSDTCDYRGSYSDGKCRTNCGNPTQRWYHVPRSFLNSNGKNILVLFEEVGGDPSNVGFQVVTPGTVCGLANENSTLELSCGAGRTISQIQFASFGDPQGNCGAYKKGTYEATKSVAIVEQLCVGKESCSINVTESTFGVTRYAFAEHKLAVQALC